MNKLFALVASLRPKNIHDLNRLIQSGYNIWTKVYGFIGESAAAAEKRAEDISQAIAAELDGVLPKPDAEAPAPTHVEA